MQDYYGTKHIKAKPMSRAAYNEFRGWTLPSDENGDDEGYLVEYQDGGKPNVEGYAGYVSWSPKEQFDKAYQPLDALSFSHALEVLKEGLTVKRAVWHDSKRYVELNSCNLMINTCDFSENPNYGLTHWNPANEDILANDWQVVGA